MKASEEDLWDDKTIIKDLFQHQPSGKITPGNKNTFLTKHHMQYPSYQVTDPTLAVMRDLHMGTDMDTVGDGWGFGWGWGPWKNKKAKNSHKQKKTSKI
ncbi:hypothetical protein ANCCAN_00788 [Ancylostoma caninum]|uniref:Uncharacterized protein n=1 Tax=Ancylostoma caninum TaxID=29170 RepID=A0A368HC64_ANCCA|nr:hypothetical protein ANCCAN_00788 [Ancylostoma caninum]